MISRVVTTGFHQSIKITIRTYANAAVRRSGHTSQVAHHRRLSSISVARSDKEYFYSLHRWMGSKSIVGLPPALNSLVLIYTPGLREAP